MKDKEKQIKEMAIKLQKMVREVMHDIEDYSWKDIAKELYKIIIPEDSVVLPKSEYEEYKKVVDGKAIMVENITDLNRLVQFPIEYDNKIFDDIADFGNYVQEQAQKETAEKLIARIKQFLSQVQTVVDDDKYSLYPKIGYKCSQVDDFLDEIEKTIQG